MPQSTLGTDVPEERVAFIFKVFTAVKMSHLPSRVHGALSHCRLWVPASGPLTVAARAVGLQLTETRCLIPANELLAANGWLPAVVLRGNLQRQF